MGNSQTTVQDLKDYVKGSCKIELEENSSWVDLGFARAIGGSIEDTALDILVSNGSKRKPLKGLASQLATVNFELLARSLEKLYKLRGKIDNYTTTSATPVVGATQEVKSGKWAYDSPIDVAYLSAVAPTITVSGSVDGALSEGTDFFVYLKGGSTLEYTVTVVDTVNVTTLEQDLTFTINYTPIATQRLSTGGKSCRYDVAIRLTNLTGCDADQADVDANPALGLSVGDPIYRVRRLTFFLGETTNGITYEFQDKDATDPLVVASIEMQFMEDDTRVAGDQLFSEESYVIAQ